LREKDLDLGFGHADAADLHLCMGSSLRVTPAADMPITTFEKGGKVVIIKYSSFTLIISIVFRRRH
jgi:NAD-dependent SIR2 family protein deacetylase